VPGSDQSTRGLGQWNAYVLQGRTAAQRRARLAEVPDEYREQVESHVRTYYAIMRRRNPRSPP